jgi:hypothetical protein
MGPIAWLGCGRPAYVYLYLRVCKSLPHSQLRISKSEELPVNIEVTINPVRMLYLYQLSSHLHQVIQRLEGENEI